MSPIIDYEFLGWAQAAEPLAQSGTRVVISPVKALQICLEKDLTDTYFVPLARLVPRRGGP